MIHEPSLPLDIWHKIFQSSPIGITVSSMETGLYVEANDQFLEWVGKPREEVIGKSPLDLGVYSNLSDRDLILGALKDKGYVNQLEVLFNSKNGILNIMFNAKLLEGGKYLLAVGQDITLLKQKETESKRLQDELTISKNLFENIFRLNPAAVTISEVETGRYLDANEAYCRLIGFERKEIIGHTSTELNIWITKFDRARLLKEVLEKGWTTGMEASCRRKNGEIRHVISGNSILPIDGKPRLLAILIDITESKLNKEALELAVAERTKDLNRTLEDLKKAQDQLVFSEKMSALGQLIAGVAHEINNPLGAISALSSEVQKKKRNLGDDISQLKRIIDHYTDFELHEMIHFSNYLFSAKPVHFTFSEGRKKKKQLEEFFDSVGYSNPFVWADRIMDLGLYDEFYKNKEKINSPKHEPFLNFICSELETVRSLDSICLAVERTSKIVYSLKNYTHFDRTQSKSECNIVETIETVLTLYQNKMKMGVECNLHLIAKPIIKAYPDELIQVWTNLIYNSLQAMDYKGKITITVDETKNDVIVKIFDTGSGIPKNIQSRIFEPFFTTKAHGEGSGLGLGIVKQSIVEKHKGTINFTSEPGATEFVITIPKLF